MNFQYGVNIAIDHFKITKMSNIDKKYKVPLVGISYGTIDTYDYFLDSIENGKNKHYE